MGGAQNRQTICRPQRSSGLQRSRSLPSGDERYPAPIRPQVRLRPVAVPPKEDNKTCIIIGICAIVFFFLILGLGLVAVFCISKSSSSDTDLAKISAIQKAAQPAPQVVKETTTVVRNAPASQRSSARSGGGGSGSSSLLKTAAGIYVGAKVVGAVASAVDSICDPSCDFSCDYD